MQQQPEEEETRRSHRFLRLLSMSKPPPSLLAHALKEQQMRRMNTWTPSECHVLRSLVEQAKGNQTKWSLRTLHKYSNASFLTHASDDQKRQLDYPSWRKAFYRHSIDKRLRLRPRAFRRLFPSLHLLNRMAFKRLFDLFDSNASGRVEFSELLEHLHRCQHGHRETNIAFVFEWFKDPRSAVLTSKGIELMIQAVKNLNPSIQIDQLADQLLQGQANLSLDEFRLCFDRMDVLDALLRPFDIVTPALKERDLLQEYAQLQWHEGDVAYVISKKWWTKWMDFLHSKFPQEAKDTGCHRLVPKPGPIANHLLCHDEQLGTLLPELVQNLDLVLVSWTIWKQLIAIYGGGPALPRKVVAVNEVDPAHCDASSSTATVDLYPLPLYIRVAKHDATRVNLLLTRKFFLSPFMTLGQLVAKFGIVLDENATDVTLWIRRSSLHPWEVLEYDDSTTLDALKIASSDELLIDFVPIDDKEDTESDTSSSSSSSSSSDPSNGFQVAVYRPVGNDFVCSEKGLDYFFKQGSWNPLADALIQKKVASSSSSAVGFSSNASMGGLQHGGGGVFVDFSKLLNLKYRSRLLEHQGGIRATGLVNMGNTCFMNCALQCIGHSPIFREYFLSRRFESDINKKNVLGTCGRIATAYGKLMDSLWNERALAYVLPDGFRDEFTCFRRHFQEARQHDAHEFIVSLLDALHEDLNRKDLGDTPYYGLLHASSPVSSASSESSDVSSESLASSDSGPASSWTSDETIGSLSWEAHAKRNSSIVVDLFHGQLRNETICRSCGERTASFDPFLFFSLPIPESSYVRLELKIVLQSRFNENDTVVSSPSVISTAFWIQRGQTVEDLCRQIATVHPVDAEQLMVLYTRRHRIKRVINQSERVENLVSLSELAAYERPSTFEQVPAIPPSLQCCGRSAATSSVSTASCCEDLVIGARVDGVDFHGDWCSGTVVDISENENPMDLTGRRICVHFDAQSSQWNRWFSQADWTEERLQPLHSKTSSAIRILEIHVVHRFACSNIQNQNEDPQYTTYADAMNQQPTSPFSTAEEHLGFQVFGTPLVVTIASNATSRELHHAILLQTMRFIKAFDPLAVGCGHEREDPVDSFKCADRWMDHVPYKVRVMDQEDVEVSLGDDLPFDSCEIVQQVARNAVVVLDWNGNQAYQPNYRFVKDELAPDMADNNEHNRIPLEKCMDALLTTEELSLEDHWSCERCGTLREATRRSDIWKLPDLVMIQLKRFQFFENQHRQKVCSLVDFPLKGLDFSPWMTREDDNAVYDLYAVANHVGGLARGHYTAFCRYDQDFEESAHVFQSQDPEVEHHDLWFRFDDERVMEVPARDVVSEAAYVLFYKRRTFSSHNVVQYAL